MSRDSKQEKFGKAKYKAGYLGCLNCSWSCEVRMTDQALRDFVYGDQRNSVGELPRFTITVDRKELKITQTILGKGGKRKVPLDGVLMKDLLFAAQGSVKDIEGMVGCVYYGYNSPPNGWPLTVHGYLFDSAKSATRFVHHLRQYIDTPEHREIVSRTERALVDGGWLVPVQSHTQGLPYSAPPDQSSREDSLHGDGVEVRRGLRRTPFLGAGANPLQATGDGMNSRPFDHMEKNPHLMGPIPKGPHRLPRTILLLDDDTSDEVFCQSSEPIRLRSSLVPSRTPSNVSRQLGGLPRFQPMDYGDHEIQRLGSRSPDNYYAPTGGLPRDFYPTDSDYRSPVEWRTDGSSVEPRPRVASYIAAELKSKLGHGPILLPPKDYDTINRTRGNMVGIEARKCLNADIVGSNMIADDDETTSF